MIHHMRTVLLGNISLVKEEDARDAYFICGECKFWMPEPMLYALRFRREMIQLVPSGSLIGFVEKPLWGPALPPPNAVFFDVEGKKTPKISLDSGLTIGASNYQSTAKTSKSIIARDIVLAGWLWDDPFFNFDLKTARFGLEDIHYHLILDTHFLRKMYGRGGLSSALDDAALPGNPAESAVPMTFHDIAPDGTDRGVTENSFFLGAAGDVAGDMTLKVEHNAWHVKGTDVFPGQIPGGPAINPFDTVNWLGRGPAPAGWMNVPISLEGRVVDSDIWVSLTDDDVWWAYHPLQPDGPPNLKAGDYVLMRGVLWQDGGHDERGPWNLGNTKGHDGWLEMHPPDWIVRVSPPAPAPRKATTQVALITNLAGEASSISRRLDPPLKAYWRDFGPEQVALSAMRVGWVEELIDARYTDMTTVTRSIGPSPDRANVEVTVQGRTDVPPPASGEVVVGVGTVQGRFKAVYTVTWEMPGAAVCCSVPGRDRVDLFVRGADNALWHRWYDGGWSPWESLGGILTSDPAAISPSPGIIYVFARALDHSLSYQSLKCGQPQGWQSLGGVLTSAPAACAFDKDDVRNQLHVYVIGTDRALYRRRFDGTQFLDWENLGGSWTSKPVSTDGDDNTWVFVTDAQDRVWFQNYAANGTQGFDRWGALNAWTDTSPAVCRLPAGLSTAAGSFLLMYARGPDGFVWTRPGPHPSHPYSWETLGGKWPSDVAVSHPAATTTGTAAWIFVRTADNALKFRRIIDIMGSGEWQTMGDLPTTSADTMWHSIGQAPIVTAMAATNNRIFATTPDNRLLWREAVVSDAEWHDIGHANSVIALAASTDKLFAATRDGHLWRRELVDADASWELIGRPYSWAVFGTTIEADQYITAMACIGDRLLGASSDNRLLSRSFVVDPRPYARGSGWTGPGWNPDTPIDWGRPTGDSGGVISVDWDSPFKWVVLGHANSVVAMTAVFGRLYASADGQLWRRDPVSNDLNWDRIGEAAGVTALAGYDGVLYAVKDQQIWSRTPSRG